MNNISEHKYLQFKSILSGCRTILDAYYFADLYTRKHPDMKNIVYSMINGKKYENIHDFTTVINTLADINNCQYQEDATEIVEKINNRQNDLTQTTTYNRIIKNKQTKPREYKFENQIGKATGPRYIKFKTIGNFSSRNVVKKECPHCNHVCSSEPDTLYIICGYNDTRAGYDWEGCGKDWCFQCKKILCKTWDINKLFLEQNCIHDGICCKQHAIDNGKIYPDDYCQCDNEHVKRL